MNVNFGLENLFSFVNNLTAGIGVEIAPILDALVSGSSGLGV